MAALRARPAAIARRLRQAALDEQRVRARRAPIDEHAVLYESFAGNGMLCNPEAIFRRLLAMPDLQGLRHVWALSDLHEYARTVAEFADDPRVSFVRRGSRSYYATLSTAKYLVNNATFPAPFSKRDGQIYLNTWHGSPIKAMGYDVPGGAMDTGNVVRNFVSADYLLAPNPDTERMYLTAYRMANIFRGSLIAEGTPRIDHQFADEHQRARIRRRLVEQGVVVGEHQKVLLYAPTWRGDFYAPDDDIEQIQALVDAVNAGIDTEEYRLLVKVHQRVYELARARPGLRDVLVPNEIPTNDVLAVTAAVITDYSSIFVDFLATGRPVLFYTPDLDEYVASRGLYLAPDQLPGPVCTSARELVTRLNHLDSDDADGNGRIAGAYAAARDRYCKREGAGASARVIDIVFRGARGAYELRNDCTDGRTPILVQLGGLRPNGITSAALSLLENIDHARYDVSVSFPRDTHDDQRRQVERIDPRVRIFPQSVDVTAARIRVKALLAVNGRRPGHRQVLARRGNDLMRSEWTRAFGASRFDHVIDFSGYFPYWIKLLANRKSGSFSIWLHNDVRAELANADRAGAVRANLQGAVALYSQADHLVSVSAALNDLNRAKLAEWAPGERFTFARNTINAERIHRLAQDPIAPSTDDPNVRTFVTAGRLSPEKNHRRLIRAFETVHRADGNTRLVILGSGPLRDELAELVHELALGNAVTMAGHVANPYPVLSRADCFVLSSDYEGQPIALLEALVLGLPIVTTDFDSVRGALPEHAGRVVARDVDALASGMLAFLRGEVASSPFDAVAYNRAAMDEFYRATS